MFSVNCMVLYNPSITDITHVRNWTLHTFPIVTTRWEQCSRQLLQSWIWRVKCSCSSASNNTLRSLPFHLQYTSSSVLTVQNVHFITKYAQRQTPYMWLRNEAVGLPETLEPPKKARSRDSLCTSISQLAREVAKLVTTVAMGSWFGSRHCFAPTEVPQKLRSGYFSWCDVKKAQGHWRMGNKGWVLNRGGIHP